MTCLGHSAFECKRSVVAVTFRQMALKFHYVMENAADTNHVDVSLVKQEMTWAKDNTMIGSCTVATISQVIAPNIVAEFGAGNAANSHWVVGNVADCGDQQPLVANTRDLTEIGFRVSQQVDDIFSVQPLGEVAPTLERLRQRFVT